LTIGAYKICTNELYYKYQLYASALINFD